MRELLMSYLGTIVLFTIAYINCSRKKNINFKGFVKAFCVVLIWPLLIPVYIVSLFYNFDNDER